MLTAHRSVPSASQTQSNASEGRHLTDWTPFAGVSAGASAGLTGLTFLVVAFRFDTIAASQEFRNRAAQTLSLFVAVTVVGVFITVPQSSRALGLELVAVALASAVNLKRLDAAALLEQTTRTSVALQVALGVFVGSMTISGLLLLLGNEWGMYFYVATAVAGLVWGVIGAWTFLTRAGMHQPPEEV